MIMCALRWWENEHRIRQAARSIKKFMATADERMHNVISLNARR